MSDLVGKIKIYTISLYWELLSKLVHSKYYKHWIHTLAATIDCRCLAYFYPQVYSLKPKWTKNYNHLFSADVQKLKISLSKWQEFSGFGPIRQQTAKVQVSFVFLYSILFLWRQAWLIGISWAKVKTETNLNQSKLHL